MSAVEVDRAALLALLPEASVGIVQSIEPIRAGLSGAGVYAIAATGGAFVLRVQARQLDESYFAQQLRVLRRASDAGIAPPIVHVDEAARAVVSLRIVGRPLGAALADPAERPAALGSVIDGLRTLHGLDASGVAPRDPLPQLRREWQACLARQGLPSWLPTLEPTLAELSSVLASDPRRSVSHNDVNPGNFLWDGARAWLVDWEFAGLGHPYYDLASLALFLRLDDEVALALVARHDGAPLDAAARDTFRALRRLVGLLTGFTFFGLVDDLRVRPAESLADAPSLGDCYAAMRAGTFDLQSQLGRASMGLALLASAVR